MLAAAHVPQDLKLAAGPGEWWLPTDVGMRCLERCLAEARADPTGALLKHACGATRSRALGAHRSTHTLTHAQKRVVAAHRCGHALPGALHGEGEG